MANTAALAAADKKASDVRVLDVSDRLVITDCFVIASGRGERQVEAIVENIEEKLRATGYKPARREGVREGRWALLDYVEIVVHVQHEEEREYYALERLWKDCPAVEVAGLAEHAAAAAEEADADGPESRVGDRSGAAGRVGSHR